MTKLERFMEIYERHLRAAVVNHPDEYPWPPENVPTVAARMRIAIWARTYNKDGRAFKATCKELAIPWTYAGINGFVGN